MDAINTLATITQLLGIFVQERRETEDLQKQQFFDWLERHRHEEIKDLICNTHHLSEQVDAILREGQTRILAELHTVNSTLTQLMSGLQALSHLAQAFAPEVTLSDFAKAALCHFEDSGETNMITLPDGSGVQFGNSGTIEHEDPRFLDDDMDALAACGFIAQIAHHTGYSVYRLTRQGATYARHLKEQAISST
ncbi:MAG: hypothetical protein QOD99_2397 [Chthoniobacter sp.]|jgi:hypothetical protein|nr:hypothetical protein [Chthoniobacter sp.]